MDPRLEHSLAKAADLLRGAARVAAFTGAGVSVASGIPDFRSPGGLWTRFDPYEVASTDALENNPRGVWEFLLEAVPMFGAARPNPAHLALAELERAGRLDVIVTQNIDGLHQAAGSGNVVEFHGHFREFFCQGCRRPHDAGRVKTLTRADIPWWCGDCGGLVRPAVVFFGEAIPVQALRQAEDAAVRADAALIVGTSGEVAPANALPWRIKAGGGAVVEVNLGPTAFAGLSDVRLDAPAEVVLPALARMILGTSGGAAAGPAARQ